LHFEKYFLENAKQSFLKQNIKGISSISEIDMVQEVIATQ